MLKHESKSIGDVLSEYFKENTFLRTKIAEHRAVAAWRELLGTGVNKYTKNVYLKRNTLYVQLSSSVLRAELQMNKESLIEKLNEAAGMPIVYDIVLR
jgi:predicted nucleic acid-binding Zn ribbon protein